VLHEPVYIEKEIDGNIVEAAIQYNDGYNESVFSFANTINTPDGGTHLTGLRAALTRTINEWANARTCSRNRTPASRAMTRARA
jgi:DNA gyrase subunit B